VGGREGGREGGRGLGADKTYRSKKHHTREIEEKIEENEQQERDRCGSFLVEDDR